VNQHGRRAQVRTQSIHCFRYFGIIPNVGGKGQRSSPLGPQLVGNTLGRLEIGAHQETDVETGRAQLERDRTTDVAPASGHQRDSLPVSRLLVRAHGTA
jgi:hypothetical protein